MLAAYDRTLRLTLRLRLLMLLFSFAFIAGTAYYLWVLPKGFLPSEDTGQIYAQHGGAGGRVVPGDAGRPGPGRRDRPAGRERGGVQQHGRRRRVQRHQQRRADVHPTQAAGPAAASRPTRWSPSSGGRRRRCPGIKVFFQNPPPIRIGGRTTKGLYQLTIQGPDPKELVRRGPETGGPAAELARDPRREQRPAGPQPAAQRPHRPRQGDHLGVSARQIEDALANAYGSRQVTTIYAPNNEYRVILEVKPEFQRDPALLSRLYVRSTSGVARADRLAGHGRPRRRPADGQPLGAAAVGDAVVRPATRACRSATRWRRWRRSPARNCRRH